MARHLMCHFEFHPELRGLNVEKKEQAKIAQTQTHNKICGKGCMEHQVMEITFANSAPLRETTWIFVHMPRDKNQELKAKRFCKMWVKT